MRLPFLPLRATARPSSTNRFLTRSIFLMLVFSMRAISSFVERFVWNPPSSHPSRISVSRIFVICACLGSEFTKSFAFVFGKCHDVFLHIQFSLVDYEDNIPHYLRHCKGDMTVGSFQTFLERHGGCVLYVDYKIS